MFAKRVEKLHASGIRKIFELASKIENPVNLSIGQAHFDVPKEAKEAANNAINDGFNGYTVTQGIDELNHVAIKYVKDNYGVESETSFITGGASGGLLLSFLTLIDRGDEILLPDPYFVMYYHLANLCEAKITYYNLYPDFELDIEELDRKITKKTKAILINSPGNPTGGAFSESQIKSLCEICKKNKVIILSDEIYSDFIYDFPHISPLKYYEDTILISGMSKTWGMAGWRMGYVIGPNKYLDRMKTLQQFTFVCPPSPLQMGAITAMNCDISRELNSYKIKRDMIYSGLKDNYQCVKPHGSFYIFPQVPDGYTDIEFVEKALDKEVLLVPGSAFSAKNNHFRISFAADDNTLKRGIELLNGLVRELRQ